jgi:hypothetical protein
MTGTSVPKAAVKKYRYLYVWENKIRPASQHVIAPPASNAFVINYRNESKLCGFRVSGLHARHDS